MAYDRHESLDVYKLQFEEFPGLTVRVRKANFAGLLAVAEAMPILRRAARDDLGLMDLRVLRAWRRLCRALGGALVNWDLLNSGEPVPATPSGLMAQDLEFIMTLASAWQKATARTSAVAAQPTPARPEAKQRPVQPPARPAVAQAPNPLALLGLNPDGTDPETGLDEEWLSQFKTVRVSGDEVRNLKAVN